MGMNTFFLDLFAPKGWPLWVAPEYGRYQFWDTIQQMTFFVNTVISQQAVMKFHGVGDPTKTPASAAVLEMSRDLLALVAALVIATPSMTELYRDYPRFFRMQSEVLNACGHFLEIMAALFSGAVALLYAGPLVCKLSGTMSGAVRSVILQHFARDGQLPPGRDPDYGDISLKESNQDKAGKVVGLVIGVGILAHIGMGTTQAEQDHALIRSVQVFALLSVVHILGNLLTVLQLDIPPRVKKEELQQAAPKEYPSEASEPFLRRMFLPKGYPHTVVECYTRYRYWSLLGTLTNYPKQVVTSMLFWSKIYGVGNAASSPSQAVITNIFMMSVECIIGLAAGLPILTQCLDYGKRVWFLRSAFIGKIAELLMIVSAFCPGIWFYVMVVLAKSLSAFAGTSGSRIGGAVAPAMMRRSSAERGEIELIHISVSGTNQDRLLALPMGVLSTGILFAITNAGVQPSFGSQLACYLALQVVALVSIYGRYRNLPPVPCDDDLATQRDPAKAPLLTAEGAGGPNVVASDNVSTNVSTNGAR